MASIFFMGIDPSRVAIPWQSACHSISAKNDIDFNNLARRPANAYACGMHIHGAIDQFLGNECRGLPDSTQNLSGYSIKTRAKIAVRLESATTPRTAVKQSLARKSFWTGDDGITTSKYVCTFEQPVVCQIEVRESLKLGARR
jgi:hypothetical protein